MVAIKTDLQAFRRLGLEKENTELIVVEIKTLNCFSVILYTFYGPSGSSPEILHDSNSSLQSNAESSTGPSIYWSV